MVDQSYISLIVILAIMVRTVFAFVKKFYQFSALNPDTSNTSTASTVAKTLVFDHIFIITGIVGGTFGWLGHQFIIVPLTPAPPDFIILMLTFAFAYLGNDILNRGIGH